MIMQNSKYLKKGKLAKKALCFYLVKDLPVKPPRKMQSHAEQFEAEENLKRFMGIILEGDLKVLDELVEKRKNKRKRKGA